MKTWIRSNLIFILVLSALLSAPATISIAQEADEFSIPNSDASASEDSIPATDTAEKTNAEAPTGNIGMEANLDSTNTLPQTIDEVEQIEMLAANNKFTPTNPSKDPFKPLVEKKVILPPAPPPTSTPKAVSAPPAPPPPKPIQLVVTGICGNDSERLALITFEGKPYTVQKDQVVDGKFKVVDIMSDRVVIYSNKEQMRRTFPLGSGGGKN